jgi:hypothetical protein
MTAEEYVTSKSNATEKLGSTVLRVSGCECLEGNGLLGMMYVTDDLMVCDILVRLFRPTH